MNEKPHLILRFKSFELIPSAWALRRNGKEIILNAQDFKVLCCLAKTAPDLVERKELLTAGWGKCGEANYLDGSIHRLRMILGKRSIRTIRGVGHRLMPKVVRQTSAEVVRPDDENVTRELKPISVKSSWLYSDDDLAQIEAESNGNTIWIISPDLANVTGKAVIIDAVEKNIKRGITYTYIVPESDTINGVLPGLISL